MDSPYSQDVVAINNVHAVPKILEVICRTTGMGFSAVARVTETHWVACAVRDEIAFGLKLGGELAIATTICNEIRQTGRLVVFDNAEAEKLYCDHHTPRQYGFKSYISVPIVLKGGHFFGTLCAIDPHPRQINRDETIKMFELFSELIAHHLEAQRKLTVSEQSLTDEREASQLREQFIAVLGHDLRNPLGAISSGTELLRHLPKGEASIEVLDMMQSSVDRMAELIDNVMDFARGRLGGGLSLEHKDEPELGIKLQQVINELRSSWPQRHIEAVIDVSHPIRCSGWRLSQMLSNLVANALVHGDQSRPVIVTARTTDGSFVLSVANLGVTIPRDVLAQLFQPFVRGTAKTGQQGLGLGLYIASEIATAHGGTLTATSADGLTCFKFRMPINSAG